MKATCVVGLLAAGLTAAAAATASGPTPDGLRARGCQDRDGDGFGLGCRAGRDCNDRDASVHPRAVERCDLRDNNCDALVDEAAGCPTPTYDPRPVRVPAGPFVMGSELGADDERPPHVVEVSAVLLDRTEVTNQRYRECVSAGACTRPALSTSHLRAAYFDAPAFDLYPVIFVSWDQAAAFCRYAGGRLPSEAEWEKAARGLLPERRTYPWGDKAPDCTLANLGGPGSCLGDTDLVGRRPLGQSPFGALDMAGNVWEWVADWYDPTYYETSPEQDPRGPAQGTLKVMRGGCWISGADSLRVSCRKAELPRAWADNVGFRCAYDEGGAR